MSQFPTSSSSQPAGPAGSSTLVLVGVGLAVVAVVLMNIYVEMRVAAQNEDTVTFYEFKEELKVGDEITFDLLKEVEIPKSMQQAFGRDAIRKDPASDRPADGTGEKLIVPVIAGEFLRFSQVRSSNAANVRPAEFRNFDEITVNVDSKQQPPNLRPGDYVDLYAAVPGFRQDARNMRVMEYVKIVNLGERTRESGTSQAGKNDKYGTITFYIQPDLTATLLDIQRKVVGNTFNLTRRDPGDKTPRELEIGGSREINPKVPEALRIRQ